MATVVPNMMCMMNPIHESGVHPGVKQIQIDCPLYFYSSCLFIHLFFHTITKFRDRKNKEETQSYSLLKAKSEVEEQILTE